MTHLRSKPGVLTVLIIAATISTEFSTCQVINEYINPFWLLGDRRSLQFSDTIRQLDRESPIRLNYYYQPEQIDPYHRGNRYPLDDSYTFPRRFGYRERDYDDLYYRRALRDDQYPTPSSTIRGIPPFPTGILPTRSSLNLSPQVHNK